MLVALPIVSFFCVVILGAFAAGPRIRTDVAQLALVLWLLVCNLIQGINSLVWAGNTDIHVPRWCDLGKKLCVGLPNSHKSDMFKFLFDSDQSTVRISGCYSGCMYLYID